MLTVFLDMKGLITIDFFEKDATLNSASYCQLLWQNSPFLLNDPHIIWSIVLFLMFWQAKNTDWFIYFKDFILFAYQNIWGYFMGLRNHVHCMFIFICDNMPDMVGLHYLNFLYQLMAIRSSRGSSHLLLGTFHMFYKYTTDITCITESGRKKNKQTQTCVRREKFWPFSGILCICGYHERASEWNSNTATRSADSSSHAGWPGFWVHKSKLLVSVAASLWLSPFPNCC